MSLDSTVMFRQPKHSEDEPCARERHIKRRTDEIRNGDKRDAAEQRDRRSLPLAVNRKAEANRAPEQRSKKTV